MKWLHRMGHPIFVSSFVSGVGNWLSSLVIFIWVFEVTGSAGWMSLGIFSHRLPIILGAYFLSKQAESNAARMHVLLDIIRGLLLLVMAAIVYFQAKLGAETNPLIWVIPFLIATGIRSFTSGTDGALKAKIFADTMEKEVAAGSQQVLQSILGVTGFISSILFIFGIKHVSFLGVLLFDAMTFFLSAVVLVPLIPKKIQKVTAQAVSKIKFDFWSGLAEAPSTWHLIFLHSLRVAAVAIPMQASLAVLKTNFDMGPESTGYLYAILTFAWFATAQITIHKKLRFGNSSYIFGIFIVSVLSPVLWVVQDLVSLMILTFFIWSVDGFLLASVVGDLQRESSSRVVGRVFSSLAIVTNVFFVSGSVLIGFLADRYGFLNSSILVGVLVIAVFIIGEFSLRWFLTPLGHTFYIRRWLKNNHCEILSRTINLKMGDYLSRNQPEFSELIDKGPELQVSTVTGTYPNQHRIFGVQMGFDTSVSSVLSNIKVATVEVYERWNGMPDQYSPWTVYSSGVATYCDQAQAERRAYSELIERDSNLLNHFLGLPPVAVLNLKSLSLEELRVLFGKNFEEKARAAIGLFDEAFAESIPSTDPEIQVYQCFIRRGENFSFGWSNGSSDYPISKAFFEAIAAWRIYSCPRAKLVRNDHAEITKAINPDNYYEFATKYLLTPSELQVALVLFDSQIQVWFKNRYVNIPQTDFVTFMKSRASAQATKPNCSFVRIDKDEQSPLWTARAVSEDALLPQWPIMNRMQVEATINSRTGRAIPLASTINMPSFIY